MRDTSCRMTRGLGGTLSCVCGVHLTPVPRALAIASTENCIKHTGYRSRTTTACPKHLEALEKIGESFRRGVLFKEMLGARRGCPDYICRTAGRREICL